MIIFKLICISPVVTTTSDQQFQVNFQKFKQKKKKKKKDKTHNFEKKYINTSKSITLNFDLQPQQDDIKWLVSN